MRTSNRKVLGSIPAERTRFLFQRRYLVKTISNITSLTSYSPNNCVGWVFVCFGDGVSASTLVYFSLSLKEKIKYWHPGGAPLLGARYKMFIIIFSVLLQF